MCIQKARVLILLLVGNCVYSKRPVAKLRLLSPVILDYDLSCLIVFHLRLPEAARGKSKHYSHLQTQKT